MTTKLYIEGTEEAMEVFVELVREKLGKGIHAVNAFDKLKVLDGSERCNCGGIIQAKCIDCGEEYKP